LAAEVASITDSLLKEISCEEIEKSIEASKPFFVFFGTKEQLTTTHHHIRQISAFDRFTFNESNIDFYYNHDTGCKVRRDFTADHPAVALYLHKDVLPFTR